MPTLLVLAGACAALGLVILLRPRLVHRYVVTVGRLNPDEYPFTGRRIVWYRRSSIVPFAFAAVFIGTAFAR